MILEMINVVIIKRVIVYILMIDCLNVFFIIGWGNVEVVFYIEIII